MEEHSSASFGDAVWVAAGTYIPAVGDASVSFVVPDGVSLYGGFAGGEAILGLRATTP